MRHDSRIESFQNADGGNGSLRGGFPAMALWFMVRSFTAAVLRREEPKHHPFARSSINTISGVCECERVGRRGRSSKPLAAVDGRLSRGALTEEEKNMKSAK